MFHGWSQDTLVHIAMGLMAGVLFLAAEEMFLFSTVQDWLWGLSSLLPGALSPGLKWPGHETDHSPPSRAKVENGGAIYPLPHTFPWESI